MRAMLARLRHIDTILDARRNQAASGTIGVWPCVLDLVDLPVVAHLIQLPEAIFIPPAVYEEMIGIYVEQWRDARKNALLNLLNNGSSSTRHLPPCSSPLDLPSALFWCTRCKQVVKGTSAMTHSCCYGFDPGWSHIHRDQDCSPWID